MSRFMFILIPCLLLVGCIAAGSETASSQPVAVIWPAANEAVDTQPVLQWQAFPDAVQYQIIVTDTATSATLFADKTTETVMPVSPALPTGANYTWTVQAQDANGEVIGEGHSFFYVKDVITAVWPNNGESVDNKPILQWEAYPGVTD